jgi:hypothetical protein
MFKLLAARKHHFPEGWFDPERNIMWWGSGLNADTMIVAGAKLTVPDLRSADNRTILDLRTQNYYLLSSLRPGDCLQLHWSIDDDYFGELVAYENETRRLGEQGKLRRFSAELREMRAAMLRSQLGNGIRRREQIHVYLVSRLGAEARAIAQSGARRGGVADRMKLAGAGAGAGFCLGAFGGGLGLGMLLGAAGGGAMAMMGGQRAGGVVSGTSAKAVTGFLDAAAGALHNKLQSMQGAYTLGSWEQLETQGMARHIRKILNPALESAISESGVFDYPVDPLVSIRENCLRSDITLFEYGAPPQGSRRHPAGLYYQGHYHGFFVLYRLPAFTRPGMWLNLFSTVDRCVAITQTLVPLQVDDEVKKLQKEIEELAKFIGDPKSEGVGGEIERRRARLDSLLDGVTQPFSVMTVVRVWGASFEEFEERVAKVRTALAKFDGAEFVESNERERTRRLFLDTIPGYARYAFDEAGKRNTWMRLAENHNIADLMPMSSTFTGHLADAQALLDSPGGGLVGIRFLAQGTPQHTSVTGVTGAGKTVAMLEMLSQMEAQIDYLFIQEEGMAFAPYAMIRGLPSVVLRDSSEYTINPFDTFRQPLSPGNIGLVAKLGIKIVGMDKDESRNRRRENLIADYASALYRDLAEDIKGRDEERWFGLTKRAMLVQKSRGPNDDLRDGFMNYKELLAADAARVAEIEAGFSEKDVIDFQTNPRTRDIISAMVFTDLAPEEYPTWSALCSVMKSARMSHHRSGAIADELNFLVSDMARGQRFGGTIGPLLDGATTVDLHGPGLHFDTSYLSDGLLKSVAGFLFPSMVRQHIISLPRSQFKFMVLDEMRRILLIPGAAEYIKEMLAQLRKYRTALIGAFQGPSQIDEIDPALTTLIFGQCKQHILMRQNDRSEIARIAEAIDLPPAAQRAIANHPLIEHQRGSVKRSYYTLFSRDGTAPTCGTVAVEAFPQLVWVASSNGDLFDRKQKVLRTAKDPMDAVHAEVEREIAAREAKAQLR